MSDESNSGGEKQIGTLYLCATPIGNLEDMTYRAVRILGEVPLIAAEDTRHTRQLLTHFGLSTRLVSYHEHNKYEKAQELLAALRRGENMAVVTDAGTPAISDPGFMLVRECIKRGVEVECLPGATAFVPALVNSGLAADHFIFEGFLPHKKGRQTKIKQIVENEYTTILYESPFRLVKTLEQLAEMAGPERRVSVARELTKIHEENVRGTLEEVIRYFKEKEVKGEIVIILEGKD